MSLDLALMKRRLYVMLAVDGVCALVAMGAAVGAFVRGIDWLLWVFVGAVALGVAVQIWFIAGVMRAKQEV